MKCPNCGYKNRETASFCQGCGRPLPTNSGPTQLDGPNTTLTAPPGTRPLSGVNTNFAPLPEGALLHQGEYVVWDVQDTTADVNIYRVEALTSSQICPHCQSETALGEKTCSSCGADIPDTRPLNPRYRVRESISEHAFATEARALELNLEHPSLILPHQVFVEAPYGPSRYYLVEPEPSPPLATSLRIPQDLAQVLRWGESLSKALNYLHSHAFTFHDISLKQIAVQEDEAYWTNLGTATFLPEATQTQTKYYFSQDIQGLAATLVYLATGNQQFDPTTMPEPAAQAFSQALAGQVEISAADFAAAMAAGRQALRHPSSITLVAGHRTDVGRHRSLNEDSLLNLSTPPAHPDTPVGLFAVADGMGGHAAGDVASRLAIQVIEQLALSNLLRPSTADLTLPAPSTWLATAVTAANQAVYEQRQAAGTDMGTTLVIALIVGNVATIANVGDSRAYLLNPNRIVQITTDHSLVERLIATGQITAEQAAHHPQKNVIYRVIGDKPETEIDMFKQWLSPGEAVLLCSDGLSGMVSDQQIWETWKTSASPQQACDRLIEAANQAGGDDNITAMIIQMD